MKNQLIQLYLLVCQIYDNQSSLKAQSLSNFKPRFTDQELVTIYLFGHLNGLFKKSDLSFCLSLLGSLVSTFAELSSLLPSPEQSRIKFSNYQPPTAHGFNRQPTDRSRSSNRFVSGKRLHFHGVRRHLLAQRRAGCLPVPFEVWFRAGNVHDLTAFKEYDIRFSNSALFGDKAFCDTALRKRLKEQNIRLFVPLKKPKGKEQTEPDKSYSRLVSKFPQPIESFFKWLNDKTQIQTASAVRSANGLLLHCYGKLSFTLLLLVFYS